MSEDDKKDNSEEKDNEHIYYNLENISNSIEDYEKLNLYLNISINYDIQEKSSQPNDPINFELLGPNNNFIINGVQVISETFATDSDSLIYMEKSYNIAMPDIDKFPVNLDMIIIKDSNVTKYYYHIDENNENINIISNLSEKINDDEYKRKVDYSISIYIKNINDYYNDFIKEIDNINKYPSDLKLIKQYKNDKKSDAKSEDNNNEATNASSESQLYENQKQMEREELIRNIVEQKNTHEKFEKYVLFFIKNVENILSIPIISKLLSLPEDEYHYLLNTEYYKKTNTYLDNFIKFDITAFNKSLNDTTNNTFFNSKDGKRNINGKFGKYSNISEISVYNLIILLKECLNIKKTESSYYLDNVFYQFYYIVIMTIINPFIEQKMINNDDKINILNVSEIKNFLNAFYINKQKLNDLNIKISEKINKNVITYLKIRNDQHGFDNYNYKRFNIFIEDKMNALNEDNIIKLKKMYIQYNSTNKGYEYKKKNNNYLIDKKEFNDFVNTSTNYSNSYLFGNFTNIFLADKQNDTIANEIPEIYKNLTAEKPKPVFILGYGASGAGKTSSLIYNKEYQTNGVLIELCNKLGIEGKYNKLSLKYSEFYRKYSDNGGNNKNIVDDVKTGPSNGGDLHFTFKEVNGKKQFYLDASYNHTPIHPYRLNAMEEEFTKTNFPLDTPLGEIIIHLVDTDRFVKATTNNPNSSRSHTLVYVFLENSPADTASAKKACIIVGDFAGVENKFDCESTTVIDKFLNVKRNDKGSKNNGENFYSTNSIGEINDPIDQETKTIEMSEAKEVNEEKLNQDSKGGNESNESKIVGGYQKTGTNCISQKSDQIFDFEEPNIEIYNKTNETNQQIDNDKQEMFKKSIDTIRNFVGKNNSKIESTYNDKKNKFVNDLTQIEKFNKFINDTNIIENLKKKLIEYYNIPDYDSILKQIETNEKSKEFEQKYTEINNSVINKINEFSNEHKKIESNISDLKDIKNEEIKKKNVSSVKEQIRRYIESVDKIFVTLKVHLIEEIKKIKKNNNLNEIIESINTNRAPDNMYTSISIAIPSAAKAAYGSVEQSIKIPNYQVLKNFFTSFLKISKDNNKYDKEEIIKTKTSFESFVNNLQTNNSTTNVFSYKQNESDKKLNSQDFFKAFLTDKDYNQIFQINNNTATMKLFDLSGIPLTNIAEIKTHLTKNKITPEFIEFITKNKDNIYNFVQKIEEEKSCRVKIIKEICDNRVVEGLFINESLSEVRNVIKETLYQKNKTQSITPDFIDICFEQYCPNHEYCFNNKEDYTREKDNLLKASDNTADAPIVAEEKERKIARSKIFDDIYNKIKDYFGYEDNPNSDSGIIEMYKDIIISVFCVFNISIAANNPPPTPYVDINTLKFFFYNFLDKDNFSIKNQKNSTQLFDLLKKAFDKISYYNNSEQNLPTLEGLNNIKSNIVKEKTIIELINKIFKDIYENYDESASQSGDIRNNHQKLNQPDEIIELEKRVDNTISQSNELNNKPIDSQNKNQTINNSKQIDFAVLKVFWKQIYNTIKEFIDMIDKSNATSAIGTLEFLDQTSKFNNVTNVCSLDENLRGTQYIANMVKLYEP
jgi:hypothetical protein